MKRTDLRLAVTLTAALLFVGVGARLADGQPEPMGPNGYVTDLVDRLASTSAVEREEAREGLLSLGATAVPFLISRTESDDPILRWEAINLLGAIGDPRAVSVVMNAAVSDSDVHFRWRANWALTRFADETIVSSLIAILQEEDSGRVWNAAVCLSLFGSERALPHLYQGLTSSGWRQWEAVHALGRVFDEETTTRLAPLLRGGTEAVRKEAVLSLGRIGGETTLDLLLEALRRDPSSEVRWRAAMMIGSSGDVSAVPHLRELMKTEVDPIVLQYVQTAITRLES